MDIRFVWRQDRVDHGMFCVYWGPGNCNLANHYIRKFAPTHHKNVRPIYLYIKDRSPDTLKGCFRILQAPTKSPKLLGNRNNATKQANLPVRQLTNLERLYNSRI